MRVEGPEGMAFAAKQGIARLPEQETVERSAFGRPSKEAAQKKSTNLLAVARDLFAEFGYRAISMRRVAQEARISTRTLYNHYPDKLSLFNACLDFGARAFPRPPKAGTSSVGEALHDYAIRLVLALSGNPSLRLGILVHREGHEFPELLTLSEANQRRYLIQPMARYLIESRLCTEEEAGHAAFMFIAMALADWQRRISYRLEPFTDEGLRAHADFTVRVFLNGIQAPVSPSKIPDTVSFDKPQGRAKSIR